MELEAELFVLSGQRKGDAVPVGSRLRIGRSPACELVLDVEGIVAEHCRIEARGERFILIAGAPDAPPGADIPPVLLNGMPIDHAPIYHGDHVGVGAITLEFCCPAARDPSRTNVHMALHPPEQSTIEKIADPTARFNALAAAAIADTHVEITLDRELQSARREVRTFYELGKLLGAEDHIPRLLERVVDLLREALSADRAVCLLRDARGDRIETAVVRRAEDDPRGAQIGVSKVVVERTMLRGVSVLTQCGEGAGPAGSPGGARSTICVPLVAQQIVLGALYVDRRLGRPAYGERDLELLAAAARQIGLAVERSRFRKDAAQKTATLGSATRELELRCSELEGERSRLRAIIDGVWEPVIVLDPAGRLSLANAAAKSLLESLPEAAAPEEVTTLGDLELGTLARDVAASSGPVHREVVATRAGEQAVLELHAAHVRGRADGPLSAVVLLRDVTEHRLREERLRQSESLASLGEMVAGVAHEIESPLTAVSGFAQILLRHFEEGPVHDDVRAMTQEIERCQRIVRNLLGLARKRLPERDKVEMGGLVRGVAEVLGFELRNASIALEVDACDEPFLAEVDRHEIQQVLFNLVRNAAQALRGRSDGRVRIALRADAARAALAVEDDGPGVPEALRSRLFQPFFTTKREGEGTGLGLSIAQRIVRSHGGELRYAPREGGGSVFSFDLPRAAGTADGAAGACGDKASATG